MQNEQTVTESKIDNSFFWYDAAMQEKILRYLFPYYGLRGSSIEEILIFGLYYQPHSRLRDSFQESIKWVFDVPDSSSVDQMQTHPDALKYTLENFCKNNDTLLSRYEFYFFIINMKYLVDSGFISGWNSDLFELSMIDINSFNNQNISITHHGINRLLDYSSTN